MDARASSLELAAPQRVDFAEARSSIAVHGKSFALASFWFGRRTRDEVAAVYAFCRRADDAIDLAPTTDLGPVLAHLSEELDRVYRGEPQTDPVLHAFQTVALARGIPKRYPQELLLGMQMDVEHARYADLPALLLYCHRVAGVVGLMMCHVLGVDSSAALANAVHLGVGMQLTNIARDVLEDHERGRTYLPAQLLRAHGVDWLSSRWTDAQTRSVGGAVQQLLREASRYYRSGDRGLVALPFRAALAVRTARYVYAAIGDELARRGFDVRQGRARVSAPRKLAWLLWSLLVSVAELPRRCGRLLARRPHRAAARSAALPLVRYEDVLPL